MRAQEFIVENKQATAQQVLRYINKTHHEPFQPGEKMHDAVMAHPQWQLQRVPLLNLNIPDQEYDDVDYDEYEPEADPYNRVMTVDPGHAGEISQHLVDRYPIVIDADRYIIDGNHRAWAAKYLLNRDYIQAWAPVTKPDMSEAFDRPYKGKWEHGDESHDLLVKLPDGSNLSIMFSLDYGAYGDEEWTVEFWRDNSQDVTGAGDQQRIFATVLSAIKKFIDKEHPERIRFSANKDVEPRQKSMSRSNLYNRLVQRYANSWGYDVDIDDFADTTVYNLHTINESVTENFADGKVKGKSRPGRVKRAGASCDGSVSSLRAKAKKYGGERGKMYHWCANMKSGRKKNK